MLDTCVIIVVAVIITAIVVLLVRRGKRRLPKPEVPTEACGDRLYVYIKGLRFRPEQAQQVASGLKVGDRLLFVRDEANPNDPSAVKVFTMRGVHIGYVEARFSAVVASRLNEIDRVEVARVVNQPSAPVFVDAWVYW